MMGERLGGSSGGSYEAGSFNRAPEAGLGGADSSYQCVSWDLQSLFDEVVPLTSRVVDAGLTRRMVGEGCLAAIFLMYMERPGSMEHAPTAVNALLTAQAQLGSIACPTCGQLFASTADQTGSNMPMPGIVANPNQL